MKIVGKDGFSVEGLDLPRGTLVKWTMVRHSDKPLPERLWGFVDNYDENRSFMIIGDYVEADSIGPDVPVEGKAFFTSFISTQVKP